MALIFQKAARAIQGWTIRHAILLTALSTLLILAGTLTPSEKLWDSILWSYDKLGHLGLFFGWSWNVLAWMTRKPGIGSASKKTMLYASFFGALIEFLQYALPINRGADVLDFLADAAGAMLAIVLFQVCRRA